MSDLDKIKEEARKEIWEILNQPLVVAAPKGSELEQHNGFPVVRPAKYGMNVDIEEIVDKYIDKAAQATRERDIALAEKHYALADKEWDKARKTKHEYDAGWKRGELEAWVTILQALRNLE